MGRRAPGASGIPPGAVRLAPQVGAGRVSAMRLTATGPCGVARRARGLRRPLLHAFARRAAGRHRPQRRRQVDPAQAGRRAAQAGRRDGGAGGGRPPPRFDGPPPVAGRDGGRHRRECPLSRPSRCPQAGPDGAAEPRFLAASVGWRRHRGGARRRRPRTARRPARRGAFGRPEAAGGAGAASRRATGAVAARRAGHGARCCRRSRARPADRRSPLRRRHGDRRHPPRPAAQARPRRSLWGRHDRRFHRDRRADGAPVAEKRRRRLRRTGVLRRGGDGGALRRRAGPQAAGADRAGDAVDRGAAGHPSRPRPAVRRGQGGRRRSTCWRSPACRWR